MQRHVITGAASGFGFELARTLLARGDAVIACDINTAPMERLRESAQSPSQLTLRQLDVRNPAQWRETMTTAAQLWPRIDTVMNIAGVMRLDFVSEIKLADVDLMIDVNTKGVIYGTQAAFEAMRNQPDANGRGHIVNMASMAGIAPLPGMAVYCASKFAVRGYSLALAGDLKQHGIAITVVCPAGADTPLVAPYRDKRQAAMIFSAPLLTTEEVVRAIVNRVLVRRPMEITLPRRRGLLSKFAASFPALAQSLAGGMLRKGESNQRRLSAGSGSGR